MSSQRESQIGSPAGFPEGILAAATKGAGSPSPVQRLNGREPRPVFGPGPGFLPALSASEIARRRGAVCGRNDKLGRSIPWSMIASFNGTNSHPPVCREPRAAPRRNTNVPRG